MAFLIIAGLTIPVAPDGATKKAIESGGSDSRAYAGNLRSTTRWERNQWQFTTKHLSESDASAIETALAGGPFVSCSGDALGTTVTCRVTVGDGPYRQTSGGFRRSLVLTLRQV